MKKNGAQGNNGEEEEKLLGVITARGGRQIRIVLPTSAIRALDSKGGDRYKVTIKGKKVSLEKIP